MQESDELLEQQLQILQQVRLLLIAVSNPFISQSEMNEKMVHKNSQHWDGVALLCLDVKDVHKKCSIQLIRDVFYEYEHFIWTFFTSKVNKKCYSIFIYLSSIIVVPFYCGWSLLVGRAFTQRKGDSELVAQFD